MKISSKSSFTVDGWDEIPTDAWKSGNMSKTLAKKTFSGSLEGSSEVEMIMLRMPDHDVGVMAYVGIEHIDCTLDGKKGTFIVVHNAEALGDVRKATWQILPGSGTGELKGIRGSGEITPEHDFFLEYHYELGS